jgi:uncharacterized membrane protein
MQRQYGSNEQRRFPTVFVAIAPAAIVIFAVIILVTSYFSSRYGYYGYSGGWGMMGGFGGFSMLFMFPIGIIVLAVIGYVLYRGFWRGGCCGGGYMAITVQRWKHLRKYCEDATLRVK